MKLSSLYSERVIGESDKRMAELGRLAKANSGDAGLRDQFLAAVLRRFDEYEIANELAGNREVVLRLVADIERRILADSDVSGVEDHSGLEPISHFREVPGILSGMRRARGEIVGPNTEWVEDLEHFGDRGLSMRMVNMGDILRGVLKPLQRGQLRNYLLAAVRWGNVGSLKDLAGWAFLGGGG